MGQLKTPQFMNSTFDVSDRGPWTCGPKTTPSLQHWVPDLGVCVTALTSVGTFWDQGHCRSPGSDSRPFCRLGPCRAL